MDNLCLTPSFRGFRHGFASPPGFATLNVADEPLVQVLAAEAIRKAAMAAVEREGWKVFDHQTIAKPWENHGKMVV